MRFYKWPKEGRSVFVPASTHVRPGITDPHGCRAKRPWLQVPGETPLLVPGPVPQSVGH